ncbi:hypothetical protein Tco_0543318 [Tanacetum coccineum]
MLSLALCLIIQKQLPEMLNDERDEAKDYENFEKIINNHMNAAESKKKIKDVNFSFFTIITQGDYYVILFNILKANAIILDNESDVDYNAKYKDELFKFQNDAKLIQLKERMNDIFKDPHILEYYSSSSTKSNDDNDDDNNGSEIGDNNEISYGCYSDSSDEDYIQMKDDKGEGSEKKMLMKRGVQKRLREQVFNDDDDVILLIINVQTLAPWLEVDTSVIDAYGSRLNYEERFKENNIKRVQMKHDVKKMKMEDVILADIDNIRTIDYGEFLVATVHLNHLESTLRNGKGAQVNIIVGSHVWAEDPEVAWIDGQHIYFKHVFMHPRVPAIAQLWFRWISFDYHVTLGFGSIAVGLDHVNPVFRLPLERGISRVLGKDDHSNPNMGDDVDISALTIEKYLALIQDNYRSGIVKPKIGDDVEFKINRNFMRELRCKLFAGTDDEDAHKYARRVLEIVDIFHFPSVTHDAVMLRVFPITLKGRALR